MGCSCVVGVVACLDEREERFEWRRGREAAALWCAATAAAAATLAWCLLDSMGRRRCDQPQSGEQKVLLNGSVIIWPGMVPKRPQLRHGISHSCKARGRVFFLEALAVLGDILRWRSGSKSRIIGTWVNAWGVIRAQKVVSSCCGEMGFGGEEVLGGGRDTL